VLVTVRGDEVADGAEHPAAVGVLVEVLVICVAISVVIVVVMSHGHGCRRGRPIPVAPFTD
jgi:hypothetical protein